MATGRGWPPRIHRPAARCPVPLLEAEMIPRTTLTKRESPRSGHAWTAVLPRRMAAATAVLMTAAGATAGALPGGGPAAGAGSTLKAAAEAQGRCFRAEVTGSMPSNPTIANLAGQQFDMVTPGNEMKWDTTEPSNGSYNFAPGDAIVSFALAHGMRVRGHNLVWQNQLPFWVSNLPASQVQSAMENHISTEVGHYKGEIYAWDVVNEPFN